MPKLSLLVFVLILIASTPPLAAQDDTGEVISVDSSVVILNARITDAAGRHISGINRSEFSIFENGVKQEIEFFQAEETPFAAVILIDTSGSMGSNVTLARSAAINFLNGLRSSDSAAIYNFDSKVQMVQDFSNSRDVTGRLFDLRSDGMTSLNDAIYKAAELLGERPEARRAIVVLSDGADTQSGRSASRALKAAMAVNAVIYSVDMAPINSPGKQQNRAVLKNFADRSGGTFVDTPGGARMRDAFGDIVEELGVQYTLGYNPKIEKKDGKWRDLELRVSRPGLTIRTRKGYVADK
ncbi:MAG TPA: VWA domain-containing protein [Pyrinomonadaceae bacterium]|nr:VWA domain-containing protein [Pyrinomonadaceae bacterium]